MEEIALISEIRNVLRNLQKEVEAQQDQNRAARQRLEADWSDKKHAYGIDSINSSLNNKSATVLFRPGATRYLDELSVLHTRWTALANVSDSISVNRPKSAGNISPWPHWMTVKRSDRNQLGISYWKTSNNNHSPLRFLSISDQIAYLDRCGASECSP